jgi:acyl-[acyl-carrier-protein]-phospholipid O-acyltransferase/long-chain-fatty-acid--[acyl-carrier-protein] ligase
MIDGENIQNEDLPVDSEPKKTGRLSRSFWFFNLTQFFGALNDNLFKLLLIMFFISIRGESEATEITTVAGGVFVVPFLLFLPFAGNLSDRCSKNKIIVFTKVAEVFLMSGALLCFLLGWQYVIYVLFFFMGAQSAFFGPPKYGIIPEVVERGQISRANGYVQAFSYLAIIIGTVVGPLLVKLTDSRYWLSAISCVLVAAAGLCTSFFIKQVRTAGSSGSAGMWWSEIFKTLWSVHRKKGLMAAIFGQSFFMFLAAVLYLNFIPYGIDALGLSKEYSVLVFLLCGFGIGAGSYFAGRLSGEVINLRLVPTGTLGIAVFSSLLGLVYCYLWLVVVFVFLLGFSAGFFVVPVNAYLQDRSPVYRRGRIMASSQFMGWIGILMASVVLYGLDKSGVGPAMVFVVIAGVMLIMGAVLFLKVPRSN